MEKTNFDKLLERYLNGEVSEPERVKLEAWLDVKKTSGSPNLELSKEDEEALFQKIVSNREPVKAIEDFGAVHKKKGTTWLIRIAAGLLILMAVTYVGWNALREGREGGTSPDEIHKLILNDGSIVWLKGESSLEYYIKPDGTRFTQLEGEGLFEVAKDPEHPFLIECGAATLRVVGTSFNVKSDNQYLELKVLTGVVNIAMENDSVGIDVNASEMVSYMKNGGLKMEPLNEQARREILSDTEYSMEFANATLSEVSRRLEKKFDVTIALENAQIGECHITADLTDHSLERSLTVITEILNVKVEQNAKRIRVTGTGCN